MPLLTIRRDIIIRLHMANSTWPIVDDTPTTTVAPRHSTLVRITHWVTTFCILALLITGAEIVISHPRFYWGETGNPMTPSLFDLPIPASRPWVNTGYSFVLPDQNGWSRNLHFEAAWVIIFTGLIYVISGLLGGRLRKSLLPTRANLAHVRRSRRRLRTICASGGQVRKKPGLITSFRRLRTCWSSSFCCPLRSGPAWRCLLPSCR